MGQTEVGKCYGDKLSENLTPPPVFYTECQKRRSGVSGSICGFNRPQMKNVLESNTIQLQSNLLDKLFIKKKTFYQKKQNLILL